jgi:hypothetical protein
MFQRGGGPSVAHKQESERERDGDSRDLRGSTKSGRGYGRAEASRCGYIAQKGAGRRASRGGVGRNGGQGGGVVGRSRDVLTWAGEGER